MTDDTQPSHADVLTPATAAQLLCVTTQTLRNWAEAGRLRPIRTAGGHRRYLRSEVETLAAALSHAYGPTDPVDLAPIT